MSFLRRAVALLVVVVAWSMPAGAAPKAALWDIWAAHDPASGIIVDHAAWDRFLGQYVRPGSDGVNRVAYGAVTPGGKANLDGYIDMLASVPVHSLSRA